MNTPAQPTNESVQDQLKELEALQEKMKQLIQDSESLEQEIDAQINKNN